MTYRRMPARPPRAVLGSVVLAGVVLLAGCNGDAEPVPTPSTPSTEVATTPVETATPEPTQTATETATAEPTETSALPPLPEEATQNTPEGAEAFIRYYFDVLNQLHREPQAGQILGLAVDECESCRNAETNIQRLIDNGWRFESNLYFVGPMEPSGSAAEGLKGFRAEWDVLDAQVVDETGTVVDQVEPSSATGSMAAQWTGERWLFVGSESD